MIFFSFLVACTKAIPEFDLLDQDAIPQPKFSGATVKNLTAASGVVTFAISGECDPKIKTIMAVAVKGSATFSALDSVASSSPTVSCSSVGTFSFTLKSLNDLGFAPLTLGTTYEVQLKGFTSAGLSRASSILILYSNGVGNPNIRVTGGGTLGGGDTLQASDGVYKAQILVNHATKADRGNAGHPTNGTYTLHPAGFSR